MSDSELEITIEIDNIVDESVDEIVNEPGRYKVIFLNDNVTPMEWVVDLLTRVFKHKVERAAELTMEIHTEESAVVGIFNYEVAEQKAFETVRQSRDNGFPLQVKVEEE